MIRINPPTALLMLTDLVPLKAGDWIMQNAASSVVGRLVIAFAKARGIKTINVVRRAETIPELAALGGDVCLVDGPDLASRARAAAGGIDIRLAIDAVAGDATARLAPAAAWMEVQVPRHSQLPKAALNRLPHREGRLRMD